MNPTAAPPPNNNSSADYFIQHHLPSFAVTRLESKYRSSQYFRWRNPQSWFFALLHRYSHHLCVSTLSFVLISATLLVLWVTSLVLASSLRSTGLSISDTSCNSTTQSGLAFASLHEFNLTQRPDTTAEYLLYASHNPRTQRPYLAMAGKRRGGKVNKAKKSVKKQKIAAVQPVGGLGPNWIWSNSELKSYCFFICTIYWIYLSLSLLYTKVKLVSSEPDLLYSTVLIWHTQEKHGLSNYWNW